MGKFIFVTDPHFQLSFSSRLDDVPQTFKDKVRDVFHLAAKYSCEAIIWGGDIFNNPNPKRTNHTLTSMMISLFREAPCEMYSIVGNHDVQHHDMSRVYQQPIGVLFSAGVLTRIRPGKNKILRIGQDVEIVGYNYGVDFNKESTPKWSSNISKIVVGHCHINKSGGWFYEYERIWKFEELNTLGGDFFLTGHDHKTYEIEKYKNTIFVRPGAMFRTTTGKDDLSRAPKVALIDTDKKMATYIPLNHIPAENVFDVFSKNIKKKSFKDITDFVERFDLMLNFKKKTLENEVESMDLPPNVMNSLRNYLTQAKEE